MRLSLMFLLCSLVISCGPKKADNWKATLNPGDFQEMQKAVIQHYAEMAYRNYADAKSEAEELQRSIQVFVAKPTPTSMENAKTAWINAREPYGRSEVFRFYGGPIDHEESGPEPLLNAWPMDEAYIDYVEGQPLAGIINNPNLYPHIDEALLKSLNENGGEKNISTGYHAVEFLLWGQDRNDEGPGNRSFTDYIPSENSKYADRRAKYLRSASNLIVVHLDQVLEEWKPNQNNYRSEFVSQNPQEALGKIMTGMLMLAADELMGERIGVAYETQGQEDEQSCFSDTTLKDLLWNVEGIEQVYLGTYKDFEGPGISHLIAIKDPALDLELRAKLDATKRSIRRIPMSFDQAILSEKGRAGLEDVLKQLEDLSKLMSSAARALGVRVNTNI